MSNKKIQEQISLYASIMAEIKVRIEAINTACHSETGIPGPLAKEFCYLQLRMICELIALSCLVAHGDIKATHTKRFAKEWSAERIFSMLERIHSDFFPAPVKQTTVKPRHYHLEPIQQGFSTKEDLVRLYRKCGGVLHRGNVKKLLSPNEVHQVDAKDIMTIVDKIVTLLAHHRLAMQQGDGMIICILHQEGSGNVQTVFAEAKPSDEA